MPRRTHEQRARDLIAQARARHDHEQVYTLALDLARALDQQEAGVLNLMHTLERPRDAPSPRREIAAASARDDGARASAPE